MAGFMDFPLLRFKLFDGRDRHADIPPDFNRLQNISVLLQDPVHGFDIPLFPPGFKLLGGKKNFFGAHGITPTAPTAPSTCPFLNDKYPSVVPIFLWPSPREVCRSASTGCPAATNSKK